MPANFDMIFLQDSILIFANAQNGSVASMSALSEFTGLAAGDAALTSAVADLVTQGKGTFDGTNFTVASPDVFVLIPTGNAAVDQMLTEMAARMAGGGGTDTLTQFLASYRAMGVSGAGVGSSGLAMVNLTRLHALLHNGNTAAYDTILKAASLSRGLSTVV